MTLAVYSGRKPTKAAEKRDCEVPVLPAISWPGMLARCPVPALLRTSSTSALASVLATPGGMAFGVQLSFLTTGWPSAPLSG